MSRPRVDPHDRTRTMLRSAPDGSNVVPFEIGMEDTADQRLYTKLREPSIGAADETVEEPAAGPPILLDLDQGVRIDPQSFLGALAGMSNVVALLEDATEDERQLDYLAEIDDYIGLLRDEVETALGANGCAPNPFSDDEILDVYTTVDAALRAVSPTAQNLESELVAVVEGGIPRSLKGSVKGLSQILVSLLSFAIELGDGGEIVLRVSCRAHTGDKYELVFELFDSVIGLPAVSSEALHAAADHGEADFGDDSTRADIAVAARVIEALGGEFGSREDPDLLGALYWFSIPFQNTTLPPPDEPSLAGVGVLVVEAASMLRDAIRIPLTELGARVLPAEDCDDALGQVLLAALAGDPPGVLLLDSSFAGEEVASFLAELHREPALREVPVLPIGSPPNDGSWSGLRLGEAIRKPILREELLIAVGLAAGVF